MIIGARAAGSNSDIFDHMPFSPRCQPWSPKNVITVFSRRLSRSSAAITRPVCASMNEVAA
jgi:hypothetical protein